MGTKWQRFTVEIPKGYSPAERELIGEDILDHIRERSEKGIGVIKKGDDWEDTKFPGYSKAYTESLNFKIAGKDKGKVDLTLSGDMLGALTVLSHKNGKLILGFENGTEENAIADGNIRGTYGRSAEGPKKRDFLGITKADLLRILDEHPLEDQSETDEKGIKLLAELETQALSNSTEEGVSDE